ncbi:hypothetical protein NQ315_009162 [Exocentrus adspersus]|uniref:RRM domain-containing protein n=1 Tax=Exocentrus adspersus TaxID=1586481 RepID=A0AAV8WG56_9CUCU|nr:hypothetical protein NQ315_009162 [Exocentrus adspersus]
MNETETIDHGRSSVRCSVDRSRRTNYLRRDGTSNGAEKSSDRNDRIALKKRDSVVQYFVKPCLYITGFPRDIDRRKIQAEVRKFGNITKLFLEREGEFAKVYFEDKQCLDTAYNELSKTLPHWHFRIDDDRQPK